MKKIVKSIRDAYAELSARERQVADFILQAPGEISAYPASEIASLVGVSNSTVTRFVRRIGFESYEELRLAAREAQRGGSPLFLAGREAPAADEALETFADHEAEMVRRAFQGVGREQIEAAAKTLLGARRLGFMGFRNSRYVAGYARWQFVQFRSDTRMMPGAGETMAESVADLGPQDAVLVVAVRRIVGEVKRYLEALTSRGVAVCLITDPSARVATAGARHVFLCPVESPYVFDSYAGVMAVVRLLAYEAFRQSGEAGREHLNRIEAAHEALEEFE